MIIYGNTFNYTNIYINPKHTKTNKKYIENKIYNSNYEVHIAYSKTFDYFADDEVFVVYHKETKDEIFRLRNIEDTKEFQIRFNKELKVCEMLGINITRYNTYRNYINQYMSYPSGRQIGKSYNYINTISNRLFSPIISGTLPNIIISDDIV